MSDKFITVIKLNTGEEVVAKIESSSECDNLLLNCPALIVNSDFSREGLSVIKIEPWIKTGREKTYIVKTSNVITTCEVFDKEVITVYNKFVKSYYETEILIKKPKMTKQMGYISNVKDARKILENIFNNS
tara:strand:+ start:120 stop:512 length:393 start_codon:yes stop_codon:yes gene_type:complete